MHFITETDYLPNYLPHGNATKSKKPYLKTMSSTLDNLREAAKGKKPKAAYENVGKNIGQASSASALPKNYDQASYARRQAKQGFKAVGNSTDEMIRTIYRCKKLGETFVREVQSAPEGIAVLSSKIQLIDVVRFCAIPTRKDATVLSVDVTFNLGNYYVTVTSFENPMLRNKHGLHPTHIGPFQIQHRKLLSSYKFFTSSLKRMDQNMQRLKIFGCDDEKNIIDAFSDEFPESINLQCFHHFRKYIERKLSK